MVNVLFYVFAALVLTGGLLAVTRKEPVHCALWLVVTLFGLSVLYLLLNAEFLFAVQIFIYAGGIMVLYLFVIFLVEPARSEGATPEPRLHRMLGPPVVLLFAPIVIYLLMDLPMAQRRDVQVPQAGAAVGLEQISGLGPREASGPAARKAAAESKDRRFADLGNTKVFGIHLFSRYLLAFELISVVLLVAMLGAIVLGRKRFTSYTEEEEARMLAEAHYHGKRLAPPSGESQERILEELRAEDKQQHKPPGSDFRVVPDYEE
jgi:NADH-quinone oxidoreductase subunit J